MVTRLHSVMYLRMLTFNSVCTELINLFNLFQIQQRLMSQLLFRHYVDECMQVYSFEFCLPVMLETTCLLVYTTVHSFAQHPSIISIKTKRYSRG